MKALIALKVLAATGGVSGGQSFAPNTSTPVTQYVVDVIDVILGLGVLFFVALILVFVGKIVYSFIGRTEGGAGRAGAGIILSMIAIAVFYGINGFINGWTSLFGA